MFDPVYMDGEATPSWEVLRSYWGNLWGMSKSATICPAPWIFQNSFSFNPDVMLSHKKKVSSVPPHLWRPFSQPLLVITILTGAGPAPFTLSPCFVAEGLCASNLCRSFSPTSLQPFSEGGIAYSFGDNIALRKFLADADVLTSGQC